MRSDEDYRALQEQAHMLDELTRNPGWDVLVDFMETVSKAAKLRVLNGGVKSIEDYKAATGELVGIYRVLDAPKVVHGMLEEERRQRVESDAPVV